MLPELSAYRVDNIAFDKLRLRKFFGDRGSCFSLPVFLGAGRIQLGLEGEGEGLARESTHQEEAIDATWDFLLLFVSL